MILKLMTVRERLDRTAQFVGHMYPNKPGCKSASFSILFIFTQRTLVLNNNNLCLYPCTCYTSRSVWMLRLSAIITDISDPLATLPRQQPWTGRLTGRWGSLRCVTTSTWRWCCWSLRVITTSSTRNIPKSSVKWQQVWNHPGGPSGRQEAS